MDEEKKNIKLNASFFVTGLFVVAAFLIGSLWTKNRALVQEQKKQEQTQQQPQNQPEEQLTVLGEADIAKLLTNPAAVKGDANAKVTIVEFSEFQCPFCKRYFDEAYKKILTEYGDKIRYVFHDFPLSFHQHAEKMAQVARCAGEQNKYWEMHDLILSKNEEWSAKTDVTKDISAFVQQLKLNSTKFNACLSSGKFSQAVKDEIALGQSVGVNGTPSFFINGRLLVGAQPFESFKAIIDEELKK